MQVHMQEARSILHLSGLVAGRLAIGRSYSSVARDVKIHLGLGKQGLHVTSLAGAPDIGECLICAGLCEK
jgi:hypothetical protein